MSRKLKKLSLEIFTLFFEEYFKDRLFDAIEMESVLLLKSVLNISCKDFYLVMRATDEKYQCGEIKYEMSMTVVDCVKCLGRALKRIFSSKEITEDEEKLIMKITDAFDISETMFKGFVETFEIKIKTSESSSSAVEKNMKKKEAEILEDIFGDSTFDSDEPEKSGQTFETSDEEIFSSEPVVEKKVVETTPKVVEPAPALEEKIAKPEPDNVFEEDVYKIDTTPRKRKIRSNKVKVTQSVSEDGTYEITTEKPEAEPFVSKDEIKEVIAEKPEAIQSNPETDNVKEGVSNSMNEVESLMKIVGSKKKTGKDKKKKTGKDSGTGVMDIFSAMVKDKEYVNKKPVKTQSAKASNKIEVEILVKEIKPSKKEVVIENSPFSVKGMKMLRRGVPEFRIAMNTDVFDGIFIEEFLEWSPDLNIYYHCDSTGFWLIAADVSGQKILAKQKLENIEKEDFLSIFSPGISSNYSICFMSGNQKLYFLRVGEIDITGKHFLGLSLINNGNDSEGITAMKSAAGNNENIYGLCNRIGEHYLSRAQLAPALIFFFKENENFPQNATCNLHLVEVFKKRSKLVKAKGYLEKVSQLDPFRFEYLMEDLSNLLVNFEKNTDRILNHLMICIILWEDNERYLPVLDTFSDKTGLDDLSSILEAKCKIIYKPITDFYKMSKKFEAGLFISALEDCASFFENHKSFYNQNIEFRKIIGSYFEALEKNIPDKEISDSIHSILMST